MYHVWSCEVWASLVGRIFKCEGHPNLPDYSSNQLFNVEHFLSPNGIISINQRTSCKNNIRGHPETSVGASLPSKKEHKWQEIYNRNMRDVINHQGVVESSPWLPTCLEITSKNELRVKATNAGECDHWFHSSIWVFLQIGAPLNHPIWIIWVFLKMGDP